MRFCVKVFAFLVCCAVLCSATNYKEEFMNKTVLVTGGSSGMGYETALELAQNGAHVIIVARDSNPAWFNGSDAARRINADPLVNKSHGSARFFKADVSNATEIKALFESIRTVEKDLDYAVNCAGITGPMGSFLSNVPFVNGTYDALRNNLYGSIYSLMYETRFFMEKNHSGSIVTVSSVDGLVGISEGALYSSSKWGIVGLSRSVADTHAKGNPLIRVNAVAPSLTNTSLSWQQVKWMADNKTQPWEEPYITPDNELWKEYGNEWIQEITSKSIIPPRLIARPIMWLLSKEASYITGMVLPIDRGSLA